MCLGIVGQVVTIDNGHSDLAQVDVAGAVRQINIGIIAAEGVPQVARLGGRRA